MRPAAASSSATSWRRVSSVTSRMSWLPTTWFMSSGGVMEVLLASRAFHRGRYGGDLGGVGVQALGAAAREAGEPGQQIAEGVDLADGEAAPARRGQHVHA